MQSHKSAVQRDQDLTNDLIKKSGEFIIGGDLRVTRLGLARCESPEMGFGANLRIG